MMVTVYFFTGFDVLIVLAMFAIPILGMGMGLLEAAKWLMGNSERVVGIVLVIFLLIAVLTYLFSKNIRYAVSVFVGMPFYLVNPVMTFASTWLSVGGEDGNLFKIICSLFCAVLMGLISFAVSTLFLIVSMNGFTGLFDSDEDDTRRPITFAIQNIVVFIGQMIATGFWSSL